MMLKKISPSSQLIGKLKLLLAGASEIEELITVTEVENHNENQC